MSPFVGFPKDETQEEKAERWRKDKPLWVWFAKMAPTWNPCPVCNRYVSGHTYPELKVCFDKAVKLKYFNGQ